MSHGGTVDGIDVVRSAAPHCPTTWIEAGPLTNPVPVARRVERVGSVENPHIVGAAAPDAHEGIGIRRRYLLVFPDTIPFGSEKAASHRVQIVWPAGPYRG